MRPQRATNAQMGGYRPDRRVGSARGSIAALMHPPVLAATL